MDTSEIRNVLVIVVDTLRARNVGCYGASYNTTPAIDRLAANGVTIDRAICTMSNSWISYTTMLRGEDVFAFPLTDANTFYSLQAENKEYKKAYENTPLKETVPGLLSHADIETRAIVSGGMLDSSWGWDKGFDNYDDSISTPLQDIAYQSKIGTRAYALLSKASRAWLPSIGIYGFQNQFPAFGRSPAETTLERVRTDISELVNIHDQWFYFLQFVDPHTPNPPYANAPGDWHPYDQNIRRVDDAIGDLVDVLEQSNTLDDTLIILTADHGESLGEHTELRGHGYNLYEESFRVPLILSHPELQSQRLSNGVARLKDIAPTILDAFDITPPDTFSSVSLLSAARSDGSLPDYGLMVTPGNMMVSERSSHEISKEDIGPVVGLHTGTHKYITTPALSDEYEWLFDLSTDPNEINNIASTSDRRKRMRKKLYEEIERWETRAQKISSGAQWTVDYDMKQQLEELGYM